MIILPIALSLEERLAMLAQLPPATPPAKKFPHMRECGEYEKKQGMLAKEKCPPLGRHVDLLA